MKIAFYFFGQIRCTKACLPYFVKNVLNTCPYDYDIFICTWKNNLKSENIDYINNVLHPKIFEMLDIHEITSEYNIDINNRLNANYSINMFYLRWLMYRNYQNILQYEKDNNTNYTHMFQIRTDVLFYHPFPWNTIDFNSDALYIKNPVQEERIDDEFTFSTKRNMKIYTDFYLHMHEYDVIEFCKKYNVNTNPLPLYLPLNNVNHIIRLNLDYWLVRCFNSNDDYYYDLIRRDYVLHLSSIPSHDLIYHLKKDNYVNWKIGEILYTHNTNYKEDREYA